MHLITQVHLLLIHCAFYNPCSFSPLLCTLPHVHHKVFTLCLSTDLHIQVLNLCSFRTSCNSSRFSPVTYLQTHIYISSVNLHLL